MDDGTSEFIAQLFTRIGMNMEDVSPVAFMAGTGECAAQEHAAAAIEQAAERITAPASAIRSLLDE